MKKTKILNIIFLLYPIIDLITALQARYVNTSLTVGLITRGLFILFLFFYTVFLSNGKKRLLTIIYSLITFSYITIYLYYRITFPIDLLIKECSFLFKVFSMPLVLSYLYNFYQENKIDSYMIKRILLINTLVLLIMLGLPLILNIAYPSYPEIYHLDGSMGLFYAANEISAIMVILFPYLYRTIKHSYLWSVVIILGAGIVLSIGTKSVLIGIAITSIYCLIRSIITRNRVVINIVLSLSILLLCYFSPAFQNINTRKERIDNTIASVNVYAICYNTDDKNVKDIIVSGRDEFLSNNQNAFKDASLYQKIFGLGYTQDEKLVEMDFVDIFYRTGIIGFIIYLLPFLYLAYIILKNTRYNLNISYFDLLIPLMLGFGLSILSGHVLLAPGVNIYLILSIILLLNVTKHIEDNHEKKVMYISTTGGHLTELLNLKSLFKKYPSVIVTEKTESTLSLKKKYPEVYYLRFGSNRKNMIAYLWRLFINCWISLAIYIKTRPDVIVSTGAHFTGPMLCLGKLFGSRIIFIETLANTTKRSITGSVIYQFADLFIVQWDSMLKVYKRAIKRGGIK